MRVIAFSLIILALFCAVSRAQVAEEWVTRQGYFCTLRIKPDIDIKTLNDKIDTYRVDFGLTEKPACLDRTPEAEIIYKFDLVFLKVREILDMRPPKIHIDVKIYRAKDDIDKIYVELFNPLRRNPLGISPGMNEADRISASGRELRPLSRRDSTEQGKFIAFYVFNLNTLFACEEKISASVIAHEIAHCIIDHHFSAPPPQRIAELIAQYAELHLRE